MAVQFFAPKTLGSVTLGAGALAGGGTIYWYQMPRTGRELLIKEGFLFLNSEHDYKGMFNDQKDSQEWKKESDLSSSKEDDVKTNAEKYCKEKLDAELPSSPDSDTKKKLISFCTTDGIKTVKARLIQSQKTGGIEGDDEKLKIVFAVYRYNSEFINWLKEDESNKDLDKSSQVSTGYSKLKTACTTLLKKNYKETSENHIKYGSWGCVDPGYKTIKEKIKKSDSSGEERPTDDKNWTSVKNKGKLTDRVKTLISKIDTSKTDSDPLTEDSLKTLCSSTHVDAQLSAEDSYQEKYIVIKSVCRKDK